MWLSGSLLCVRIFLDGCTRLRYDDTVYREMKVRGVNTAVVAVPLVSKI